MSLRVLVERIEGSDPLVPLPRYETEWAAGADLRANLDESQRQDGLRLVPGERVLVPTGIKIQLPQGCEMQLRPRSGLALKQGITLLNSPGTIDADYRGAVGVVLINHGDEPVSIKHGDRIAQAVIAPVMQAQFEIADTLTDTKRGAGGFGSTGVRDETA